MEKELVTEYLDIFKNEWDVYTEVTGKSMISGKNKRIDAVICSKEFPEIKFGIEFKRLDLGAFNNFTAWFKQAVVYTQCSWDGFGKLPVLIAPSINYGSGSESFVLSRLIGEFGIGEITKTYYGVYSKNVYKITHKQVKIWSNHDGFNKIAIKQNFKQYLEL
jgi:hypothetical protein